MDIEQLKQGSQILFEHPRFLVLAPVQAAAEGHVLILPQAEAKTVDDLPPESFSELCMVANYVSAVLFETLGAHGTNIVLVEEEPRLHIDIIARKEGDGLDLLWTPRQLQQTELDEVGARLRDKTFMIGKEDAEAAPVQERPSPKATTATDGPVVDETEHDTQVKAAEKKENHLIRQLYRVP